MTDPILIAGSPGSPYTRKMLAVLRYRRLPYRFVHRRTALDSLPAPKVPLLPTFYFPDDAGALAPMTDSTPIIRRLDHTHDDRQVIPTDPALALIDALIEDYGDEWLTKAMFHYRWSFDADIAKSATVLPNWFGKPLADAALATMGDGFAKRQIGRLGYVGSNAVTSATIEVSYKRLLAILDRHFATHHFLLGDRPGASDFAIYGQLTQLALFDPTPMAHATANAPRVIAWAHVMEDLSGEEGADWFDAADLPATTTALLTEIGHTYVPLLLANADAVHNSIDIVSTVIDGRVWEQAPFSYQAKCLAALRSQYRTLDRAARARVNHALAGTGCAALFTDG
ncbi:glutathione S-transferase family protein [Sphingomonas sp. 28-63-12]|uniref:glutathione S-transferase family protein n=1 Tax=Sphingomonas sp. 28-63-12 TaxID=1970434 RepID=UPI000BDC33ED|nr:MAG: glutathione S-transferase [Sphingomonas sp. 28-63-12]